MPTFLWTTAEDRLVPSQNSLRYALALADHGVPYKLHVYPKGGHGMSNGSMEINDDKEAAAILSVWPKDMASFFKSYCKDKDRLSAMPSLRGRDARGEVRPSASEVDYVSEVVRSPRRVKFAFGK